MNRPSRIVTRLVLFCSRVLVVPEHWLARAPPLPLLCFSLPRLFPALRHWTCRVTVASSRLDLAVPGHHTWPLPFSSLDAAPNHWSMSDEGGSTCVAPAAGVSRSTNRFLKIFGLWLLPQRTTWVLSRCRLPYARDGFPFCAIVLRFAQRPLHLLGSKTNESVKQCFRGTLWKRAMKRRVLRNVVVPCRHTLFKRRAVKTGDERPQFSVRHAVAMQDSLRDGYVSFWAFQSFINITHKKFFLRTTMIGTTTE